MNSPSAKKETRRRFRQFLAGETHHATLPGISREICQHLADWLAEHPPANAAIATFHPLPGEIDLRLLHRLLPGSTLAYPLLLPSGTLSFHRITDLSTLIPTRPLGLREPSLKTHPEIPPESLSAILCPGLAFDPANGNRLGKGLGCYDRFLAALPHPIPLIGIASTSQLLPLSPPEDHDIPLTHLATERGISSLPIS